MKKILQSILLLMLSAALALGAVSCSKSETQDGEGSTEAVTTAPVEDGEELGARLPLVTDSTCAGVVYAMSATAEEIKIAQRLASSLSSLSGKRIDAKVETINPAGSDVVEFLVGLTKYEESKSVYADLH